MTTGSLHLGYLSPDSPFQYTKGWSGGDGRYEIVAGYQREKWNNYSYSLGRNLARPSFAFPPHYVYCTQSPPAFSDGTWSAKLDLLLQNKLVQAIKQHEFNLAVFLGEGKEAVNMVVNTLGSIGKAVTSARHGNFLSALSALGVGSSKKRSFHHKDIGSRWLELQYGWLPLCSDTWNAWQAFSALSNQPRRSEIQVSKKITGTYNGSASPTLWTGPGNWKMIKVLTYEMEENLSVPRSLGLVDPLSLAWELLPYSFVVDWFIPIGTYLENLNVIPFLTGRTMTIFIKTGIATGLGFGSTAVRGSTCDSKVIQYSRVVSSGLNTVRPSFNTIPAAMKPKRIWNAIALASQRFLIIDNPRRRRTSIV